jgi:predicted ATPase
VLLLGGIGATAEAAECFRDVIELARRQSAKSWELRATMSLARLLPDTGRHDDGHDARRDLQLVH